MNAGPHYETTAEVSLAAKLGADAVGIYSNRFQKISSFQKNLKECPLATK